MRAEAHCFAEVRGGAPVAGNVKLCETRRHEIDCRFSVLLPFMRGCEGISERAASHRFVAEHVSDRLGAEACRPRVYVSCAQLSA
jgi:hypothetical protein